MQHPTKLHPEKGDARTRPQEAAHDVIRARGFANTFAVVLCRADGVIKGVFLSLATTLTSKFRAALVHLNRYICLPLGEPT